MGGTAPKTSKRDVKKMLASAKRPERTVQICTRQDLQAEWEALERQLVDLESATREAGAGSLAGDPRVQQIADEQARLREEMLEHTLTFRIQAVSRRRWTELQAQHRPRDDNKGDQLMGFNVDDLVEALIREGTVEPQLDDEDWDLLLSDVLTAGTYEVLTNAVWAINKRDVSVPFSRAASQILQISGSG